MWLSPAHYGHPVSELKTTPLHERHLAAGAKTADFGGWDMPIEYTGVVAERYQKLGGSITLIRKPGVLHHPHGLEDSTPIVEFIWKHAASPEAKARWRK